jgi:hypothetical protein
MPSRKANERGGLTGVEGSGARSGSRGVDGSGTRAGVGVETHPDDPTARNAIRRKRDVVSGTERLLE